MSGNTDQAGFTEPGGDAAIDGVDVLLAGGTLAEAKGISEQQVEGLYALAYQVFRAGDYDKAESVFGTLCLLNHQEKRFWLGLGGARQQINKYQEALAAFGMASSLDLLDPVPPFHAGQCLMALKEPEQAANAFQQTVLASRGNPEFQEYESKALAMLELLGVSMASESEE